MNFLLKIFFFITFYLFTTVFAIISLPLLFFPRKFLKLPLRLWANFLNLILHVFFKIDYQINGELPKNQVIFAIQHQSIWETIVLANLLPGPISIVMKKELISIPFIGWLFKHAGAIPLDRGKQVQSIRRLLSSSKYAIDRGDNIIIYPQGTRVKPGVQKPYLPGIFALYHHLKIPVIPIALNSGKFWFNFKVNGPGTIKVSILSEILPGMEKKKFMSKLQNMIEKESKSLLNK